MKQKPLVYVACPYMNGGSEVSETVIDANVAVCMNAIEDIWNSELAIPYMTLLSHYYNNLHYEHSWDEWMEYDFQIISRCDYMIRLHGPSKGADQEVELAHELGIIVFDSVELFLEYMRSNIK